MPEQSNNTSVSKADLYYTAAAVLSLVLVVQISVVTKQQWLQIAALCLVIVTQMIFGITASREKKLQRRTFNKHILSCAALGV